MHDYGLRTVHIGEAIKKRLDELKMTKTEFGRLIDTPQQHVNSIFNRENIDTGKLIKICRALKFNFFSLYCSASAPISAYLSAVSTAGNALNNLGDPALLAEIEIAKVKLEEAKGRESDLRDQIAGLKDNVEQLKSQLQDKDKIITLISNNVK